MEDSMGKRKYTKDYVQEELKEKNIELMGEFDTVKSKTKFRCLICGYEWQTCLDNIFNSNTGCRACQNNKRKLTREIVNERLEDRNIEVLDEVVEGHKQKVRFKCLTCGYVWKTTLGSTLTRFGCQKCSGLLRLTTEEVKRRIEGRPIELIGDYVSVDTKTTWRCLKGSCGHVWETIPYIVFKGAGCPKCSKTYPLKEEDVKRKLKERGITLLDDYVRAKNKVNFKCGDCGHVWKTSTDSVLRGGTGCPVCRNKNEKRIFKYLVEKYQNVNPQKFIRYKNKKMFIDFEVDGVFIEYNGEQHYEVVEHWGGQESFDKQQKRDDMLREYCDKNNITLVEIPYWLEESEQYRLIDEHLNYRGHN